MRADLIDRDLVDTTPLAVRDGILAAQGYGIRVFVHHGQLAVSDNPAGDRRELELSRATCGLRRMVILGHSGAVSLESLRWIRDVGATFIAIDADATVVACYTPAGTNDVRLRRAQALAGGTPTGTAIIRRLLKAKLAGQQRVLGTFEQSEDRVRDAIAAIAVAIDGLQTANPDELRWLEAVAASAYWSVLSRVAVRFPSAERGRIRPHWTSVGPRSSPLTSSSRSAVTPFHSMLNYLTAVAETEARIAALSAGLDCEMAFLHLDRRSRSSLAHDVLEAIRPDLESYVLDIVRTRVLSSRDFAETSQGVCRLMPVLARTLAHTAPLWAARLSDVVRTVVAELRAPKAQSGRRVPREAIGKPPGGVRIGRLHRGTPGGSSPRPQTLPQPRCGECGAAISRARYGKCLACESQRREVAAPQLGGRNILASLRAGGTDPAHGGAARKKRSKIASRRHAEAMAATGAERLTQEQREHFRRELLPRLAGLSLSTIAKATSLSKSHCSFIKRGLRTPHPRHWEALLRAVPTGPE